MTPGQPLSTATLAGSIACAAALLALVLTPVVRRLAVRLDLYDHALTARRLDGQPVPRLGGIAILVGFYTAVELSIRLLLPPGTVDLVLVRTLGLGGLVIAALGVVDDVRGTRATQKFAVQFGVAAWIFWNGFRIDALAVYWREPLHLGWLALPFTLLWIVGVTNAFNLIDGLDGLAAGVALVGALVTVVIALDRGDLTAVVLSAALAGAIVGFLPFNLNPASIFMGDTGSLFLGFVLATLATVGHHKSSSAVALLVPMTALGLPIFDTLLAVARRFVHGRPVFRADRDHIHHRLLALGLPHRRAVQLLHGISAILGVVAVWLSRASAAGAVLLLLALTLAACFLLDRLGYLRAEHGWDEDDEQPNTGLRIASLARRLRIEKVGIWEAVKEAAILVRADAVRLVYVESLEGGETTARSHAIGLDGRLAVRFTAKFLLVEADEAAGFVELGWRRYEARLTDEEQRAMQLLCEAARARAMAASTRVGPAETFKISG